MANSGNVFKLSPPAYLTFVASIILVAVILIPRTINVYDPDTNELKVLTYDFKQRIVMILLLLLPLAVHIYATNCLVVGNCNWFAWFVAALIVLWVVSFILLALA